MNEPRRRYTAEFKREAVALWQGSGRAAADIEDELGIAHGMLVKWKRQLLKQGEQAFPGHGRLPADQERIRLLQRENEILRQEREILKKAVAIFSHPNK
jgi:transposase